MTILINAKVSCLDERNINGEVFYERDEIAIALKRLRGTEKYYLLVVSVSNAEEAYRGIGKLFYASAIAEYSAENVRYKIEDGTLLTYEQFKARVN